MPHARLSTYCKGRNIFTRDQQAEAFSCAYKDLPVHTTTLRNLGNFKGVFHSTGRMHKIHGVTRPRSFELRRDGPFQVLLGMKEYMHSPVFTGMGRDGSFGGEPHPVFVCGVPSIENAPPFELRTVEGHVIAKIQQRYASVHSRVDDIFGGEHDTNECRRTDFNGADAIREFSGDRG